MSLSSLVYLDLSYNQLEDLSDLRGIYNHPLTYLDVRGNKLSSFDHVINDLTAFKKLSDLMIAEEPLTVNDNPLCNLIGFRTVLFNELSQVQLIDSYSRKNFLGMGYFIIIISLSFGPLLLVDKAMVLSASCRKVLKMFHQSNDCLPMLFTPANVRLCYPIRKGGCQWQNKPIISKANASYHDPG